MVELYAIAHAFATASLSEIHPMTLIEAAMCGLPIVARRDVSFVGLVRDGYNGFLVDSDRAIAGKLWLRSCKTRQNRGPLRTTP